MELEDCSDEEDRPQQRRQQQQGSSSGSGHGGAVTVGGGGAAAAVGGGGTEEQHLPMRLTRGGTVSRGLIGETGGGQQLQRTQTLRDTARATIDSEPFAKSLRARDMTEQIMEGYEPRSRTR